MNSKLKGENTTSRLLNELGCNYLSAEDRGELVIIAGQSEPIVFTVPDIEHQTIAARVR